MLVSPAVSAVLKTIQIKIIYRIGYGGEYGDVIVMNLRLLQENPMSNIMFKRKLKLYSQLTRQDKPIGTLLLLGSTSWGLIVAASGKHDLTIIAVFVVCSWLMRSAGCIINDYADRDFDRYVQRTKDRPITSGKVGSKEALVLFAVFCLLALVLCLIFLSNMVVYAALICFLLTLIYPFMKRFVWWPQVFLAVAFSSSIPMAFLAYQAQVPMLGWVMFVLSCIWIVCYDTQYALADAQDDAKIGLKSSALWLGQYAMPTIISLQVLFVMAWLALGIGHQANIWSQLCFVVVCSLFVYQYKLCQKAQQTNQVELYTRAFKNNQWVGYFIALALALF